MNVRVRSGLGLAASALLLAAGCAEETPPPVSPSEVTQAVQSLPEPDRSFVQQAVGVNMAWIRIGQLAMERGATDGVRRIGRDTVDTHTRLNDRLRAAARQDHIELPYSAMAPSKQALYDKLAQLSGPEFDQAFLDGVRQGQDEIIQTFQSEALSGRVCALSAFADESLPMLNSRVRTVRRTMNQM
jgi:putative membrane protein